MYALERQDAQDVITEYQYVNLDAGLSIRPTQSCTNHFASTIDRTGNITNFTKNRTDKSFFFFLKTQKRFVT